MSKLPAIQFYVGDWKKDSGVQSLSYHDRGVWFEMLCLMHESEDRGRLMLNGNKMPEDALARVLGLDNQILTTTLTTLLTYGVASVCEETGAICSRRMIRDEKLRQIRKEAGSKGGNPNLVNQKSTTGVNQKATPSSSLSTSSSFINKDKITETSYPQDIEAHAKYSVIASVIGQKLMKDNSVIDSWIERIEFNQLIKIIKKAKESSLEKIGKPPVSLSYYQTAIRNTSN